MPTKWREMLQGQDPAKLLPDGNRLFAVTQNPQLGVAMNISGLQEHTGDLVIGTANGKKGTLGIGE